MLPEFTQFVSIIHPYLSNSFSRIRPNYFSREALNFESFLIALPHLLFTLSSFWITLYTFQSMCKANSFAVHLSHFFSFYLSSHVFIILFKQLISPLSIQEFYGDSCYIFDHLLRIYAKNFCIISFNVRYFYDKILL